MNTTDRFSSVFDLPRQDIHLDPARFQGRQGEYSEETVNAIVSSGRFDPTVSALVVWKDPDSGKYFLLSGHSRYEAARRLHDSGKQHIASLPVKALQNATEEEAVEYATIESNRRGTEEGLVSDLKAYRLAVNSGKNATQLKRLFRPESKLRKLQELSYLNPRGMFIEQLAAPSQQSFPYLERNARWVGDMRRQLPTLTDAHERELFDYLYGSKKGLNLDKAKFYDLVNNKVNRIDFDPDKALNLHDRISPTPYTDPLNEQMRELDKEIDTAQKEIDNRRATMARASAEKTPLPKIRGLSADKDMTFEERIAELNRHIIRLIERREAIRQAAGKVERTMTADLFSIAGEPKALNEIAASGSESKQPKPDSNATAAAAPAFQKAIENEQAFKVGDRVVYVDDNRKYPQHPAGAGQNVGIINSIARSTTAPHEPIGYDIQPDGKGYRSVYKTAKDVLGVISSKEEMEKNEKKEKKEKSKLKFWEKSDIAMSIIKLAKDNGFQLSDWDEKERTLWFETRENGDVGSETQGSADLAARKKVMQILRNEYDGVAVRADDSGTEWVAFEVTLPTQEEQDKAKATPALAKRDAPELPKARVMLVTRQYGQPIYITHLPDDKQFGFTGTDKKEEAVTWESTPDNQAALAEVLKRAKFVTGWDGLRFEAAQEQLGNTKLMFDQTEPDHSMNYRMLSRLQSDCDYFLGAGNGHEPHLHQGSVDAQIAEMKRIWNLLPADGKPDWLSMEDIFEYERNMRAKKKSDTKNMIAGHKIEFFHYPGGIQASNTNRTVRGDYEQLAFIRHNATDLKEIDWEKKGLPKEVKDYIIEYFTENVDAFKPDPPKKPKYTAQEIAEAMKDAWNYPEALNWAEKYGLVFRISASQVQWTEKGSDYYDFPEAKQRKALAKNATDKPAFSSGDSIRTVVNDMPGIVEKVIDDFYTTDGKGPVMAYVVQIDDPQFVGTQIYTATELVKSEAPAAGKTDTPRRYQLGDLWSEDFDEDGMLRKAYNVKSLTRDEWQLLYNSLVDNNHHRMANALREAIEAFDSKSEVDVNKHLAEVRRLAGEWFDQANEEENLNFTAGAIVIPYAIGGKLRVLKIYKDGDDTVYDGEIIESSGSHRNIGDIVTLIPHEKDQIITDTCPPMKDGKADISPEGLKKLKKCISSEPSTKAQHTDRQGNYSTERKALHQRLIDEFKHQRPCVVNGKPIAVLTGGAPGSGKTHFLKGFAPWLNSDQVYHIDADAVRAKLPEYKGWNADNTHEETSDIVKEMLDSIGQPCKHDLVYDGTMNKAKKYLPLVRRLKEMGYEVLVIYMQVPKEVSVSRALERYQRTGRYVPIEVIDEVFDSGLEAYEQVIREADGYIRVDGMTGEILEKGGRPIPTERNYEDVSCGPHPCNGTAETSPSLRIKLAKAKAMAARARALALNK